MTVSEDFIRYFMTLVVIIINANMITSFELYIYAHKLICIVYNLDK